MTDWIDGDNGIAAITAVSTSDGSFTMDALNLAEKLYNMLNRIAVSGNTYEDWQDAVYTQSPRRHIESPVFLGGLSSEIMFEEIVQTAPTELNGQSQALGTLGGRGKHFKRKGGHVNVKVDEASFIMGIVSITPRIVYTQGNEWYMTELKSMDDFHKPALDGIGYQDLLGERMAWWAAKITDNGVTRQKIGKVPAWIDYMTAVDKAFGDFAEKVLEMSKSGASGYASVGEVFADYLDDSGYKYGHFVLMLKMRKILDENGEPLRGKDIVEMLEDHGATPEMSTRKLDELIKNLLCAEETEEEDESEEEGESEGESAAEDESAEAISITTAFDVIRRALESNGLYETWGGKLSELENLF